jgi:multidrug efflux pump
MNFSRFFIDRPIFAGVLSTLIFVAGLLSLPALPISEYPEVAPPTVVVRAQYPGANPKVIAETVSTPIEEQINGVEGMLYMSPARSVPSASPRSRARPTSPWWCICCRPTAATT